MMKKQQGLSMLGWIIVIAMATLLSTAAIKLGPKYIENNTVHSILERIASDAAGKTRSELTSEIQKNFSVSMISDIKASDIKFEKIAGGYRVNANYEVRVPFLYNIDVIVKFDNNIVEMK